MAVKTVKDLDKLQRQMNEEFERYLTRERGAKPAPRQEDLPTLVAEARASLDAAIEERDEGLRLADQRIERMTKELTALEASLERANKKAVKKAPARRTPNARKATARRGKGTAQPG
jgi:hypothetical protein